MTIDSNVCGESIGEKKFNGFIISNFLRNSLKNIANLRVNNDIIHVLYTSINNYKNKMMIKQDKNFIIRDIFTIFLTNMRTSGHS